jgi:hypothetical protein
MYVVGMHVRYRMASTVCHEFFTGFLMYHNEVHLWLSAGHVVEKIRLMLEDRRIDRLNTALVDHRSPTEADYIPLDLSVVPKFVQDPDGFDFGAIPLRLNIAALLRRNPYTQFMTSDIWRGRNVSEPDGMYVVGHPYIWNVFNEGRNGRGRLMTNVACLPAIRVADRGESANEGSSTFWGRTDCFYGQLVPFRGSSSLLVQDIRGMSGGPILSLHQESGRLVYRL